jgi:DNA-binding cell septation regulator SpoVG
VDTLTLAISFIDVRLYVRPNRPRLRAYVDLVVADAFKVYNARIYRSESGRLRVQFPNRPERLPCTHCDRPLDCTARYCPRCGRRQPRRESAHSYRPVAVPVRSDVAAALEHMILEAYCAESVRVAALAARSA